MHVVIVGGGEVGWYLADRLRNENHDVVLIERHEQIARAIGEALDIQVLVGNGCHPSVLEEAGIERAGLLAAVTQSDEANLVVSLLGKQYGSARSIVRIQTDELRGEAGRRLLEEVGADVVMDPDADTAEEILRLIHLSGADEVYPMCGGQLSVLGASIRDGSPISGVRFRDVPTVLKGDREFLVGAVTRQGKTVIPHGDEILQPGDHVRVLARRGYRRETLRLLGAPVRQVRRVMVLGGGAVGSRVAESMSDEGIEVFVVERDQARAEQLAAVMPRARILHGDITDLDLLRDASVATMDIVVATTGEDTANILACAYAAAEGPAFTIAVIHRLGILPIVGKFGIGATLSPRTASANAVLRELRGFAGAVTTFLESDVEVNEFVIEPGAAADGVHISELGAPTGILFGAVVRKSGDVAIASGSTRLEAGDRIVVFCRATDLARARTYFSA